MVIARYNIDGSLDKAFGVDGKSMIDFIKKSGVARNLLVQKDNKIVLTGYTDDCYGCGNTDFAITRLDKNGTTDSSFGIEGKEVSDLGNLAFSKTSQLQDDNKIISIGEEANTARIILVRYNNDVDKKQIIISKTRRWLQHHNGFTWDNNSSISSYIVQRSYDGIHFNSVARINTGNHSEYAYADTSPLSGDNYYRLQTTTASGAVNYSNVLAISYQPLAISISPNPAKNSLKIQGLPSNQKIKLTVVDFTGNIAISQQLSANSSSSYNLNIASLKPGNYLLKIETGNDVVTKQFVKE